MTGAWLQALFDMPRGRKRALQVLADLLLRTGSFATAMLLRTEDVAALAWPGIWAELLISLPVTIAIFVRLGFYRAVIRYLGPRAALSILKGVVASALIIAVLDWWLQLGVPATVPLIHGVIALVTVGGIRVILRGIYLRTHSRAKQRVIVYGAGACGRQAVHSLVGGADYAPTAFVDDNPELWGTQIAGLRVFPPAALPGLIADYSVGVLLLAMPSAGARRRAALIKGLEGLPVRIRTVAQLSAIPAEGQLAGPVAEVPLDDLLGREAVPADPVLLSAMIRGRVVMVTGAGGSIGAELSRQILALQPGCLVVVEQSEYALFELGRTLDELRRQPGLRPVQVMQVMASVLEGARMERLMRQWKVQTIFHAAAFKHVPLVEENPVAGLHNNIFGTLACASAAQAAGVESFTLISTDKAVRPTSVMGASKRLAELVCQALAGQGGVTRFSMVRFGNVLGSSGSVIPIFRDRIAHGGPVQVTHPQITRYFMTLREAAELVIQSSAMARGGDVFLLDMGEPVRILDLAMRMIRMSGHVPQLDLGVPGGAGGRGGIAITFTGLRPGEKLHEELLIAGDSHPTRHPRILTAEEAALGWADLCPILDALAQGCQTGDVVALRRILRQAPIGYAPSRAGAPPMGARDAAAGPDPAGQQRPQGAVLDDRLVTGALSR